MVCCALEKGNLRTPDAHGRHQIPLVHVCLSVCSQAYHKQDLAAFIGINIEILHVAHRRHKLLLLKINYYVNFQLIIEMCAYTRAPPPNLHICKIRRTADAFLKIYCLL